MKDKEAETEISTNLGYKAGNIKIWNYELIYLLLTLSIYSGNAKVNLNLHTLTFANSGSWKLSSWNFLLSLLNTGPVANQIMFNITSCMVEEGRMSCALRINKYVRYVCNKQRLIYTRCRRYVTRRWRRPPARDCRPDQPIQTESRCVLQRSYQRIVA